MRSHYIEPVRRLDLRSRRGLMIAAVILFLGGCRKNSDAPISAKGPRCELSINDRVAFHDASGGVTKTILYEHDTKPFDPEDSEGGESFHIVQFRGCRSGAFAAVVRSDGECEGVCDVVRSTDTIDFYAADGQLKWSKRLLPPGNHLEMQVSGNDRRIWYISAPRSGGAPAPAMVSLAADGKEDVFEFKPNEALNLSGVCLSHNGRYTWVHVSPLGVRGAKRYIRFFDLETRETHDFVGDGFPEVSDDGLVKVWVERVLRLDGTYNPPGRVVHQFQFP